MDSYQIVRIHLRKKEEKRREGILTFDSSFAPSKFLASFKEWEKYYSSKDWVPQFSRNAFAPLWKEYRSVAAAFQKHPKWDNFDSKEWRFYRSSVSLINKVLSYIPCPIDAAPFTQIAHKEHHTYKAAHTLLQALEFTPCHVFTSPSLICSVFSIHRMHELIREWDTPENRRHIRSCDAEFWFEACKEELEAINRMAEDILKKSPHETIFRMRRARFGLSAIHATLGKKKLSNAFWRREMAQQV